MNIPPMPRDISGTLDQETLEREQFEANAPEWWKDYYDREFWPRAFEASKEWFRPWNNLTELKQAHEHETLTNGIEQVPEEGRP
jgi:hypothetical protein